MRTVVLSIFAVVLLASGCSPEKTTSGTGGQTSNATEASSTSTGVGGSGGMGGAPPAPPPLPIIPNQGGPVIASPEVVTVTWQGDPIASDLLAFDQWMVASSFFATMMAEWGVGPGTHGGELSIATAAPSTLDDTAIRALIQDAITQGTVPPANGSRIYTIYPPSGTTVSNFGMGCVAFQAYHSAFTATLPLGGTALAVYAVTPRCAQTQGKTPTDFTTWGQSHEVMEASSDPNPLAPAWVILKQTPETPQLGENADLCTGHPTKIEGHMVTRNYSNVAALAGERPCVPALPGPMFGAFASPGSVSLKAGESTTIPIYLYSDGALPAFQLYALPLSASLTASFDQPSGIDGEVRSLTITAASNYVEIPNQNLIELAAVSDGYPTYRFVVVHKMK